MTPDDQPAAQMPEDIAGALAILARIERVTEHMSNIHPSGFEIIREVLLKRDDKTAPPVKSAPDYFSLGLKIAEAVFDLTIHEGRCSMNRYEGEKLVERMMNEAFRTKPKEAAAPLDVESVKGAVMHAVCPNGINAAEATLIRTVIDHLLAQGWGPRQGVASGEQPETGHKPGSDCQTGRNTIPPDVVEYAHKLAQEIAYHAEMDVIKGKRRGHWIQPAAAKLIELLAPYRKGA